MGVESARAGVRGVLLGASIAMAVGRGSLWWFAVPVAVAVTVAGCHGGAWRRCTVLTTVTAVPTAACIGRAAYSQPVSGAVNSVLLTAMALVLVTAVVAWRAALHAEREEARQAQELVSALRRQRAAEIDQALLDQRVRLAGQVHDRIGHQLNYATIRLGCLAYQDLDVALRHELEQVRASLADTLDRVGELVALLEQDQPAPPLSIEAVLAAARAAGTRIEWRGHPIQNTRGEGAELVGGFLAEALANASRHAPGELVTIVSHADQDQLTVTASNPINGRGTSGSGTGLRRTRQRIELAGGRLDVTGGQTFSICLSLPTSAVADSVVA